MQILNHVSNVLQKLKVIVNFNTNFNHPGNVMNGPIGKQMVDTLVESSANVEMILKFFDIFLKMKDMTTSEAFLVCAG